MPLDKEKARKALGWPEVGGPVQEVLLDALAGCVTDDPRIAKLEALGREPSFARGWRWEADVRAILRGEG